MIRIQVFLEVIMIIIKRVLVIGLGSIGKRHLKNIKYVFPRIEVLLFSRKKELSNYEGCCVLHDLSEAIKMNVQAAFICTPSTFHLEIANTMVESGIHILIEKPVSNSSHGLLELKNKAEKRGVKVMVGYNLRFVKSLDFFRSLLQSDVYGEPLCIKAEVGQYLPDWRPGKDYRESVSAKKSLGGGALLELSHEIDYLSWIFGQPIYASGVSVKVSNLDIDVDDLVIGHLVFEKKSCKINVTFHLDFLQRQSFRQCKAICKQGTVIWDAIADNVMLFCNDKEVLLYQGKADRNESYLIEIKEFLQAIEDDTETPVSLADGIRTMSVVESIRSSSYLTKKVNE